MSVGVRARGCTVIDRLRILGSKQTRKRAWLAGRLAQRRYVELTGHEPEKALRKKSSGAGSHCFAVYPTWFVKHIDEIIVSLEKADDRQLTLFDFI